MYKYKFRFQGGGKRVDTANYKFHCFIADSEANENHLFEAINKGLVIKDVAATHAYLSAMPIVKVFSSTAGFGIAKEYYSFFFALNPTSTRIVKIKPLGFDKAQYINDWFFLAPGRFLTKEEVQSFFGVNSDAWKFFLRQSFLSKRRLAELVEVGENYDTLTGELMESQDMRMIRTD